MTERFFRVILIGISTKGEKYEEDREVYDMLYVVSDTHGYANKLKKALTKKGFFDDPDRKLLLCGDICDRGMQAVELCDFLVELLDEERLILVKGNHEVLFEQMIKQIADGGVCEVASYGSHHYRNGTWHTALQLADMDEGHAVAFPQMLLGRLMRTPFYQKLLSAGVNYYETKQYIFTHGYIPCIDNIKSYSYRKDWREASDDEWQRAMWLNGMQMACGFHIREPKKTIVCGHYHTSWGHHFVDGRGSEFDRDADFSPFFADGVIAIDACTAASGRVNVLCFDTDGNQLL